MSVDTESKRIIKLSHQFLEPFKSGKIKPKFGPVGAVTYYRTYSRKDQTYRFEKGNVTEIEGMMEHWVDTVQRVVEGNFNLVADDPTATPEKAQRLFTYIFHMGALPPGRGLWMMGTKYQQERGGDALNNCWFIAVRPQSYQNMEMHQESGYIFSDPQEEMPSFPFVFTFDRAMTGGGVGFSNEQHNMAKFASVSTMTRLKIYLSPMHPDWTYIKESAEWEQLQHILTDKKEDLEGYEVFKTLDSRQGWATSYRELIDSHWQDANTVNLAFDMSEVRGYGAKIKGFGGTASGPLPLMVLFNDVNQILNARYRERLTSVDALDIMNMTGRCVVAGNVRRTALIAIGDNSDKDYVDAKNYTLVAPIMEKDEFGYVKWENGKQVRLPEEEAEKNVLHLILEEENLKLENLTKAEAKDMFKRAKHRTTELMYAAWAQENHRWASNNSVYTDNEFSDWGFLAAGIIANGEPGVINKHLMQNFGRIMDGLQMAIDADAEGMNPCAEITLANGEPCNLIEFLPYVSFMQGFDFYDVLQLITEYVYRITFAKYEWPVVQQIIDKNHRIGVSLTGAQDYFLAKYGHYAVDRFEEIDGQRVPVFHQKIVDELDSWYRHVKQVNEAHAVALGSTPSIKLTTMKPSGTVSKLPGVSAGIHFHYSPYLLQRIRFHELDENLKVLQRCGYPMERAQREPNTVIVEFPVKAPNADHPNFQSAASVSLEEQFANQYLFAYAWADNAVSATLTFQYEKEEHLQIESLLEYYGKRVKSISLLPYSGHGYVQAPWEPITKEEYDRRVAQITELPEDIYMTLTSLENIEGELDQDCLGGHCPVK